MNKSPHILGTASNLLGFSFLVLVSIKGLGLPQAGFIDEIDALLVILFAVSCILSFISLRTKNQERSLRYEDCADFVFLAGLLLTAVLSFLLATDILLFAK
jgi:formate hydrogenlyase subunit 3/multisubunit Na+/H+ antiporter MnhD subunit